MEMNVLDRPHGAPAEPARGVSPDAHRWLARYDAASEDLSAVAGIVNAAHGRLVDLTILTLAEGHHVGPGLHTCAQYLAWQTGVSKATANQLVRVARRAEELPRLVDALRSGEISLDQADAVASRCPARYDRSATELAKVATVAQLRTVMAAYRERPGNDRPAADHGISIARDDDGATIRARVSNDEADLFERALRAMREDLVRQQQADAAADGVRSDASPPHPTMTDALAALAETALAAGQAAHAGADRYLVTYHLHRGPDGHVTLTDDQGRPVADAHRRRLLCECTLEAAWHDASGTAISVGRRTRTVAPKLRRAILFRHRHRCAVPGCDTTVGLEIHHIRHWEDGGATDTHNLVALCHHHHKVHHQGLLHIVGNADLPTGTPGAVRFAAPHRKHPLVELNLPEPVRGPHSRRTLERLCHELDRRTRRRPGPVASTPTGERLQRSFVELHADPPDPPSRT